MSDSEEAIDWYRHYMSVQPEHLLREYISRKGREGRSCPEAIEMAVKDRVEELEELEVER